MQRFDVDRRLFQCFSLTVFARILLAAVFFISFFFFSTWVSEYKMANAILSLLVSNRKNKTCPSINCLVIFPPYFRFTLERRGLTVFKRNFSCCLRSGAPCHLSSWFALCSKYKIELAFLSLSLFLSYFLSYFLSLPVSRFPSFSFESSKNSRLILFSLAVQNCPCDVHLPSNRSSDSVSRPRVRSRNRC